ncbi:hypothetical protein [Paenibacillus tyrfis]|uniref:hypothetical protein n=1 Tax=Paenibacillus tyrfis TaxID=1501230 RepID=UPI000B5981E7|nr:hypothetical protein [Paenibacillus tyrfis]
MERRNPPGERIQDIWKELEPIFHEEADKGDAGGWGREVFEETARGLERYRGAGPSDEQTKALLARLTPQAAEPERPRFADRLPHAEPGSAPLWVALIRFIAPQVRLFSKAFWIVSAVIMIFGALAMPLVGRNGINSFVFVSSFVAGIGVFYALRSYGTPMSKLEATFPVSPVEMMMGRLGIIILYDMILALAASVLLSLTGQSGPLFAFIIGWLAPLCFCTALAFAAIVRFGPRIGAVLSLAVWMAQFALRDVLGPFYFMSDTGYAFWGSSRMIAFVIAAILFFVACRTIRNGGKGDKGRYDPA